MDYTRRSSLRISGSAFHLPIQISSDFLRTRSRGAMAGDADKQMHFTLSSREFPFSTRIDFALLSPREFL